MPGGRSPVVAVHGLGKRFVLRGRAESIRDLVPAAVGTLVGRRPAAPIERWALRDVSFSVAPGETLGVIGRNGAGKSTLLRLLSRILRPTTGHVDVRGRVAALIELSAGFHFDLTGSENVHLQGAIFGMKRREIASRLDAIAAFAGLAEFMDVPLKRYSTGMVSRLGFAIAAHVDADVLLIDEVLAVGDREFQRRAVRHVEHMVRDGRPVVLVSHQLDRIAELCSQAILLREGTVASAGTPAECIAAYTSFDETPGREETDAPIGISELLICGASRVTCGERLSLHLTGTARRRAGSDTATVGIRVHALPTEEVVFATHADACGAALPDQGAFQLEIELDMNLGPGLYRIDAVVGASDAGRVWARGPSVLVRLERRERMLGRAYLNPSMRLVGDERARPPAAPAPQGARTAVPR